MQFVQHGPDIPDSLLQAHEDGRVVFFCGAGISFPARLPSFADLVKKLYADISPRPNPVQQAAIKAGQLDTAVSLLEADIVGGREAVRRALAGILTPDLTAPNATSTHEALLTLGKNRDGHFRLVTTNFDRLFEEVITAKSLSLERYHAPLLPVPKNRWDGLVYLHGLLGEAPTPNGLDRLVISSGDFGLAYLTERWAARFVSEMFRNFTVCFVGYSINDPVLRYMMDALAADRLLGESTPEAFAFGSYSKGKKEERTNEWQAKNVTPILYREHRRHAFLHRTLRAWAETYRDGIQGRERIVVDYAMTRPSTSTSQDNVIGRMLWALSHDSGLPAKRFAEHNPVPSLDWLEPLSENRFRHGDLYRFGVPPTPNPDGNLVFSMTARPAPYTLAPWMSLVSNGKEECNWDNVMLHFARWLIRHLNDPELVLWLVKHGCQLHDRFLVLIERALDKLTRLEREGNTAELNRIRTNAPNAIPQPLMRTLWRLLLTKRIKTSSWHDLGLSLWKNRLARDGFTSMLRIELRELLTPKIVLKRPFRWSEDDRKGKPERLKQLVDWELVLSADDMHSSLNKLEQSEAWHAISHEMIDDFQQLLRDALDLMRELGEAEDRSDRAHWDMPSISPHWQNRGYRDWVALIELLRDSWLVVRQSDPMRARRIARKWFSQPYPTFRRLALFAATHEGVASKGEWVEWLLDTDGWWLWSVETQRETMRLLVQQGAHLPEMPRSQLETAILAGPPRHMFRDDIEPASWQYIFDHDIWLRLSKLKLGGAPLGAEAQARLDALSEANPMWRLSTNERDEFSHWMSGTGDPDYEDQRETDRAPRDRRRLVAWLKREKQKGLFYEDNWREICAERFFVVAHALCDLARDHQWPAGYWREALQVWAGDKFVRRAWQFMAPLVQTMPNEVLLDIASNAAWWLESAAKVLDRHETIFLDMCQRMLTIRHQDSTGGERPAIRAFDHPVGIVAQALLHFWFRREPSDNQGLPEDLKPQFSMLCDRGVAQYRDARVVLASRLITFFRVDRAWTNKFLLPLFNWRQSAAEAAVAWTGFLWSPRLYRPLLATFKTDFLETANHYGELGELGRQYAAFLTYAALDPADTFSNAELRDAISALPSDGLQESTEALVSALEGASDQRESYWDNRIVPFWRNIWPKSQQFATPAIADYLARLCVYAGHRFPAALRMVRSWLRPMSQPYIIIDLLQDFKLCTNFPEESIELLSVVIDKESFVYNECSNCLESIRAAMPGLANDPRYIRLKEILRQRGCE